MAEVNPTILPEKPHPPSKAREWITSVLLITFTSLVGIACVTALSSTLTQTRMSTIAIDGVPLSIWKLDDIRIQWADIRNVISGLSESITKAERDRAEQIKELADAGQRFSAKQRALIVKLSEIILRVRSFDAALAKSVEATTDPAERYAIIGVAQAKLLTDHPEMNPLIEQLDNSYREYSVARDNNTTAQFASQAIIDRIVNLQNAMKGSRTSIETLYRQISPKFSAPPADAKGGTAISDVDEATRARIENALFELHSGRGLLGLFVNRLITTQSDILTLMLVILMGVLGSSLQMTYAFFRERRAESIGSYLLRVCVGAITALVIFIVAKAGVPVIADATRLGGDAAINPYFVSFLAIISGLMSENAIRSVQDQGARFFGADRPAEPARWARQDLREAFKSQNRDPQRVKRLVQAKDDDFDGWVSGAQPIPANIQMIIAGVLQTPPRDLFTDIPPDQAGTTI
jgi:hypothetical protein